MLMGEDRAVIDIDSKDIKVTPPRPTENLPDLDNRNVKLDQVP
jgi:ribonuclease Z